MALSVGELTATTKAPCWPRAPVLLVRRLGAEPDCPALLGPAGQGAGPQVSRAWETRA